MTTVTIDAADATELAEILTYLIERLDTPDHDAAWRQLLADLNPYRSEDLRADLTRLVTTLNAT